MPSRRTHSLCSLTITPVLKMWRKVLVAYKTKKQSFLDISSVPWDRKQKPRRCDKVKEKTEGSITWAYHTGKNPDNRVCCRRTDGGLWVQSCRHFRNIPVEMMILLKRKTYTNEGHMSIPVNGIEQWEQCIY